MSESLDAALDQDPDSVSICIIDFIASAGLPEKIVHNTKIALYTFACRICFFMLRFNIMKNTARRPEGFISIKKKKKIIIIFFFYPLST